MTRVIVLQSGEMLDVVIHRFKRTERSFYCQCRGDSWPVFEGLVFPVTAVRSAH